MLKCLILTHYKYTFVNRMNQTHLIFGSTIDNTMKYIIMITLLYILQYCLQSIFILSNVYDSFKVGRNVYLNYV